MQNNHKYWWTETHSNVLVFWKVLRLIFMLVTTVCKIWTKVPTCFWRYLWCGILSAFHSKKVSDDGSSIISMSNVLSLLFTIEQVFSYCGAVRMEVRWPYYTSWLTYNHFHNILRLLDVLPNFIFSTSETSRDYL